MTELTLHKPMLEPEFLDALDEFAVSDSWWRDVLSHPNLFLAVRRGYINAYYKGTSIYRISWLGRTVTPFTHIKYLSRPSDLYVPLRDGVFQLTGDAHQTHYRGSQTLKEICSAASRFSGVEKAGLHPMLIGNSNVIDVEISLTRVQDQEALALDGEDDTQSRKHDRIDAAIVVAEHGLPTIQFYEAKHFSNPDLRASGDAVPKVVGQIEAYKVALHTYRAELAARYLDVARVIMRVNDMRRKIRGADTDERTSPLVRALSKAARKPSIDTEVRLLIYGFDRAQRDDNDWSQKHLPKLQQALPGRVRAIGNPTKASSFLEK